MTVLFGHPTGNPNSLNAALAHFEVGQLEAFCVPWMPSERALSILQCAGPLRPMARRLARRRFPPLAGAPKVQGRLGEWRRLVLRVIGRGAERLSYEANDWLMATMAREAQRSAVTAVHAYEDCSLWQFAAAKRLGKACIYDMPIGYHDAWTETQGRLARRFADWLPASGLPSLTYVRPAQKRSEMELADLVLVPSSFVEGTVLSFHPEKRTVVAPYGVDTAFWTPPETPRTAGLLRFIVAGQMTLRKGLPDLIAAWRAAALPEAELELVGPWLLSEGKKAGLPANVAYRPSVSPLALREHYRNADFFVLPTYFEGFALALGEAMACGLPAIASTAAGAPPGLVDGSCGWLVEPGDVDGLVDALRSASEHRDTLYAMRRAAREHAERLTWKRYRETVATAVTPYL